MVLSVQNDGIERAIHSLFKVDYPIPIGIIQKWIYRIPALRKLSPKIYLLCFRARNETMYQKIKNPEKIYFQKSHFSFFWLLFFFFLVRMLQHNYNAINSMIWTCFFQNKSMTLRCCFLFYSTNRVYLVQACPWRYIYCCSHAIFTSLFM